MTPTPLEKSGEPPDEQRLIRFIQQQLGHAELSTTQIYTQVSIRILKEVRPRTHPAATLSPEARAEIDAELAEEEDELADGDGSL
jgi:integrase/recombinase XerD